MLPANIYFLCAILRTYFCIRGCAFWVLYQCGIFRFNGTAVLGSGEVKTEGPQNCCIIGSAGAHSAECGAKLKESQERNEGNEGKRPEGGKGAKGAAEADATLG